MTWNAHPNPWTPELIEHAIRLRREGQSATRMAALLGNGLTRNAVLGKLYRLGMCDGTKPVHTAPRRKHTAEEKRARSLTMRKRRVEPAPIALPKQQPRPPPRLAPPSLDLTIDQLNDKVCRSPNGDQAPFSYCGNTVADGSPWCWFHRFLCTHVLPEKKANQYFDKLVHRTWSPG